MPHGLGLKGLRVTTLPSIPVITLDDAKTFLRIDGTTEDTLIQLYVEAATTDVENHLRRALITQTFTLTLDHFDRFSRDEFDVYGSGVHHASRSSLVRNDLIYLPRVPLQTVTSIKTTDVDNTQTTFSNTNYTLAGEMGKVFLNEGSVWPTNLRDQDAIEVIYVAGYGDDATDIPAPIRRAVYNQLRKVYEERGSCEITESTKMELASYKVEHYLGFS